MRWTRYSLISCYWNLNIHLLAVFSTAKCVHWPMYSLDSNTFFSTVRCVHWIMYTLDSNKVDFTVCSDKNGWRLIGAIADLFFTKYNGNIMGVTRVHWRIYSRGVVQYIQRREAPRDTLFNYVWSNTLNNTHCYFRIF